MRYIQYCAILFGRGEDTIVSFCFNLCFQRSGHRQRFFIHLDEQFSVALGRGGSIAATVLSLKFPCLYLSCGNEKIARPGLLGYPTDVSMSSARL